MKLQTLADVASLIDHSLLHPTLSDTDVRNGCELSRKCAVATACVKPYHIPLAREVLQGSKTLVCAVIGFPHGNSTTGIKVAEAESAALAGAPEIDMVVNVGKVKSRDWDYVAREIRLINEVTTANGSLLKVIFENDYLQDDEIIALCEISSAARVAFVKTSTGYGFVKGSDGKYSYQGATLDRLRLMRAHCPPEVQIKAAGGVRTFDDVLAVVDVGATRIGATTTTSILEEAARRGLTGPAPEASTASPGY
ncbi:MAG: deoxyribose-phosphate aldolase [Terrimicrobiaceae bacterium]